MANWIGVGGVIDNLSPSLADLDGDGVSFSRHSSRTVKVRFIHAEARRGLYMPYSGGGLYWSWSQGTERQVPIQSRYG